MSVLWEPRLPTHSPHQSLHSLVDIFSMLVLKLSLGQVDGEHTGHPHKPCHTSTDEFCCDTRPWEGGRHRVKEGGWLQRAAHSKDWMGKCREKGRRAGMERSKGRNGSSWDLSPQVSRDSSP